MPNKIFINLPVKNLEKSMGFFRKLGFSFNQQFTDEKATCMMIAEHIYAMLLVEDRFKDFTNKEIANAQKATEVILSLDAESREEVDDLIRKAVDAGGSIYREPDDHGWMYGHSFADLDGHQWEVFYMDESAVNQ